MGENYTQVYINGFPLVFNNESNTDRKRPSDESNNITKKLKTENELLSLSLTEIIKNEKDDISIAQSSDDSGISNDLTQLSTTTSTEEEDVPTDWFTVRLDLYFL